MATIDSGMVRRIIRAGLAGECGKSGDEEVDDAADELRDSQTFQEAGVLTRDEGLVLRFFNGAEFQISIIQSALARDER